MSAFASACLAAATVAAIGGADLAFHRALPAVAEDCLRGANRAGVGFLLLGASPHILQRFPLSRLGLFEVCFALLPWWGGIAFLLGEVWLVRITAVDASGLTLRTWHGRRRVLWDAVEQAALDERKPRLILWCKGEREVLAVSVAPALVDLVCHELRTRLSRGRLSHELWDRDVDLWAPGSAGWKEKERS